MGTIYVITAILGIIAGFLWYIRYDIPREKMFERMKKRHSHNSVIFNENREGTCHGVEQDAKNDFEIF